MVDGLRALAERIARERVVSIAGGSFIAMFVVWLLNPFAQALNDELLAAMLFGPILLWLGCSVWVSGTGKAGRARRG